MRSLKKLTCGIDLANIIGKPYEKNVVDFILFTCEDAREVGNVSIEYHFYYNGKTNDFELANFSNNFKNYESYMKIHHSSHNNKNTWFRILTNEEYSSELNNRACYVLNEITEKSLIHAFLDFYSKATSQLKLREKKIVKK